MARYLIREAHGGETRIIRDGALPYFLNQGYVVLDTLDDEDDASPLYLSKAEGDLRWVKITDLGDPESAEGQVLRAAFDAWGGGAGVDPDDVGFDLVLLLGQSNMSGRGTPYDQRTDPPDTHVFQYGASGTYAGKISQAVEPLAMHDTPTGIGPGLVFARWYAASVPLNRRVLLVPAAHSNTGLSNNTTPLGWRRGVSSNLYAQALAQAQAALAAAGANSRFVAALWVQGEHDGNNNITGAAYQADLDALISGLRTDLDVADLPFVIGQMVPEYLSTGTRAAIDTVQRDVSTRLTGTAFALGPAGQNLGDGDHYNAAGQRILGRRLFQAYRDVVNGVASPPPDSPPTALTITATPGDGQVTITAAGGAGASSVALYRGTEPTGTPIATSFPFTDTGRPNETPVSYIATATNDSGSVTSNVATATPTAVAPTTYAADTFTRADSSSLGTAETGGQAWQKTTGATAGIASNQLSVTALQAGSDNYAWVDDGQSDGTISCKLASLRTSGLMFRGNGTTGYVVWHSAGKYNLAKITGNNAYTQLAQNLGTAAAGDALTVVLNGSSIVVELNGVEIAAVTDASYAGTRHGFWTSASSTLPATFDDFSHTSAVS